MLFPNVKFLYASTGSTLEPMKSVTSNAPSSLNTLLIPEDAERGTYENIVDNFISNFVLILVTLGISSFLAL